METIVLFKTLLYADSVADWANSLIGDRVPGYDSYVAERVMQIQVIPEGNGYLVFAVIAVSDYCAPH